MAQPTLILSPRHTDSSQTLWRKAIQMDWNVERLAGWRIPNDFRPEHPVIYGEPLFNQTMSEHLKVSLPEPPENFLTLLPKEIVGRKVTHTRAYMARKIDSPHFIKPPNKKTFKAAIYESGAGIPIDVPDDEPVLVQEIVEFVHEYRLFFMANHLVAASSYIVDGAYAKIAGGWNDPPGLRSRAIRFGRDVANYLHSMKPGLTDSVVLDVGHIRDKGWAVIEANEINASGIYNADPERVLLALYYASNRTLPDPYRANFYEELNI